LTLPAAKYSIDSKTESDSEKSTLEPTAAVEPEFDRIADLYDETRRALGDQTVSAMRGMLSAHFCKSILEIGVGTGRVARPLLECGFEVTGMDISSRMMEKAKPKGVKNLVRADGSKIPFQSKTFDATLMAHVFHLLENPFPIMREAARISKIGLFGLVRGKEDSGRGRFWLLAESEHASDEDSRKLAEERRARFRQIAEKYGWKWDLSRASRAGREHQILETFPPDDLKVLSDTIVTQTLEDLISRFEKGAYSFLAKMPDQMRKEIVEEMRKNVAASTTRMVQRREVYELAMWKSERLSGTSFQDFSWSSEQN
jgi:ubiquinone/menaquinone biosynthesis C-methylase UbiE